MSSLKRPIELLAPARDCEAVVAAVDYGADAVYIGGARFGARHAAANDAAQRSPSSAADTIPPA